MNLKTLSITLLGYGLWLIFGIIIIMMVNENPLGGLSVAWPLVSHYISLVFYIFFVVFKLFKQWRARTVVMGDNKILLFGALLFFVTANILGSMNLVPLIDRTMNYAQYLSATIISLIMFVMIIIASYRLKKSVGAGQPSKAVQKLMITTLVGYIVWIMASFGLLESANSSPTLSSDAFLFQSIQVCIFIYYGLVVFSSLRMQRRSHTQNVLGNNLIIGGGFLFAITPIIMLVITNIIGYTMEWSLVVTLSHLGIAGGAIALLLSSHSMIKKIKSESGAVPQAVEARPGEVRKTSEEEKARKQAEADARKKVDAEAKQRQKTEAEAKQKAKDAARAKADEEKAKRKAEEESRKRAVADEKLRRRAEQDAQKKAEYEAEMRRRAEAEAKAKAEADAKQRAEEDAKMKKLQQLVKVSDRLSVARMAQLLEMPAEEVWKHVPDWAEKFNFRIAGEELVFNKENLDAFVASLDAEFRKWGKDGKV